MLFRIQGRVLDADDEPISHLRLVVVDDDDDSEDDLLGVGRTNEDGVFRMNFTRAEFNQDAGEDEETPDLRIVFSVERGTTLQSVHEVTFPELVWPDTGEVDLGDLAITSWVDHATTPTLPKINPTPGHRPLGLPIDDDLIHTCLHEVAPLVEDLTGWSNLTDDLTFLCIGLPDTPTERDLHHTTLRSLLEGHADSAYWFDALKDLPSEPFHVRFDPISSALYIHVPRCTTDFNRDALLLHIGRALVRVGQTRNHPELLTLQRSTYQDALDGLALLHAQDLRPDLRAFLRRTAYHTLMCDLEGYAHHIYEDFLKTHYPVTDAFPPHILPSPLDPLSPPSPSATDLQRVLGRLTFAPHRSEHRPAPFATRAISVLERDMRPIESRAFLLFLRGETHEALALLEPLQEARHAFLPSLLQRNSEVTSALISCLIFTHQLEHASEALHTTLQTLQARFGPHHPHTLSFLTTTSAAFRIYASHADQNDDERLALLHARLLHARALETPQIFLHNALNAPYPTAMETLEGYLGEVEDTHRALQKSAALDPEDIHPKDREDLQTLLTHAESLHLRPTQDPWVT